MSGCFNYELLIREFHIDTFGHVNNATYLQIFEEARWEWITRGGYSLNYIRETQKGPIVLDVHLKFKKEIYLREKITVQTRNLDPGKKISSLEQNIIKEDGTLAAEAVFTVALFDLQTRKIILPTPEWLRATQSPP